MAQLKEEEAKYNAPAADSKVVDAARQAMAEKYEDMDEETRNRLIEEQRKAQIALQADAKRRAAYEADLER